MKYVYLSIPLLALAVLVEYAWCRFRGLQWHEKGDSWANMGCGLLEQTAGKLIYPLLFVVYLHLYDHYRLLTMRTDHIGHWVVGFVLSDLAFYWFHRLAHSVNLVWATHIVHHQSSQMNLTVAMRNGAVQRLFAVWFYLPLAIVGIPGPMMLILLTASMLYQFMMHTRCLGSFGSFGWLFNTPSHHRVHHAINPQYIDKNLGGILIVWDRIFGTFVKEGISAGETSMPVYGVSNPELRTKNPVVANFIYWAWLIRRQRTRRDVGFRQWFARPGST